MNYCHYLLSPASSIASFVLKGSSCDKTFGHSRKKKEAFLKTHVQSNICVSYFFVFFGWTLNEYVFKDHISWIKNMNWKLDPESPSSFQGLKHVHLQILKKYPFFVLKCERRVVRKGAISPFQQRSTGNWFGETNFAGTAHAIGCHCVQMLDVHQ